MAERAAAGAGYLKDGKCMIGNWEEERAVAALDTTSWTQIQRHGHRGIIAMGESSEMETATTYKADYVPLKSQGLRLSGIRGELFRKHITQEIREQIRAEQELQIYKTDFCSTTREDFCVKGFVPLIPETTQVHDYKTDQAVTFWSDSCRRIQGVTPVQDVKVPFRKSSLFSTPISERLDETDS